MKIFGYSTLLMSAGIAEVPKSDSNPKKRIQTLVGLHVNDDLEKCSSYSTSIIYNLIDDNKNVFLHLKL